MRKVKKNVSYDELVGVICPMRGDSPEKYNKRADCNAYRVALNVEELKALMKHKSVNAKAAARTSATLAVVSKTLVETRKTAAEDAKKIEILEEALELKEALKNTEVYEIKFNGVKGNRETIAIAQLSDWHIEDTVNPESVLYRNEYNLEIAQKRMENFFINLCKLVSHHQKNYRIKKLVLAILGDMINGWIHESYQQTNSVSPIEALTLSKKVLTSGLKYLHDNLDVETIDIVCICGNHSRITSKVQHGNFVQTSYEYLLYTSLQDTCEMLGLKKFNFIVPKASMVVLNIFGKNYLFAHGHQFRYGGGIGGIYVPMIKWFLKQANTFNIEKAFIGHWHTLLNIPEVAVNGSVKGYDTFAMDLGFKYELPQQALSLLSEKHGFSNHQPIYLD